MSSSDDHLAQDAKFRTTRWSLVQAAGDLQRDDSSEALSELCQSYWFPVYAYFRRRVGDVAEAQDLTQEFFARMLEKNYLADVRRDRGRFRTFLLTAAQRFLSNEWAKANAQKRGGGQRVLSLDFAAGESQYALEPVDDETPVKTFDRQWAIKLLEVVHDRLRYEYVASGKGKLYERLKPTARQSSTGLPRSGWAVAIACRSAPFQRLYSVPPISCRYYRSAEAHQNRPDSKLRLAETTRLESRNIRPKEDAENRLKLILHPFRPVASFVRFWARFPPVQGLRYTTRVSRIRTPIEKQSEPATGQVLGVNSRSSVTEVRGAGAPRSAVSE